MQCRHQGTYILQVFLKILMLLHSDMGAVFEQWMVFLEGNTNFPSTALHEVKLSEIPFSIPLHLHQLWTCGDVKNRLKWVRWERGKTRFYRFPREAKDTEIVLENILTEDNLCLYLVACLCFLQVPRYLFWYLSRKPWFKKPVMYYGEWMKWVVFLELCLFWCKTDFIFGGNNTAAVVWNTVNGVVKVH